MRSPAAQKKMELWWTSSGTTGVGAAEPGCVQSVCNACALSRKTAQLSSAQHSEKDVGQVRERLGLTDFRKALYFHK